MVNRGKLCFDHENAFFVWIKKYCFVFCKHDDDDDFVSVMELPKMNINCSFTFEMLTEFCNVKERYRDTFFIHDSNSNGSVSSVDYMMAGDHLYLLYDA